MNLIKCFLICFLIIFLNSCDTYSTLWIENNTNNKIKIISTESIPINDNFKIIQESNNKFIYELNPLTEHQLFGIVNESITKENIPFDRLTLINLEDTILLNNRSEIFEAMVKNATDYYSIIVE